MTASMSDYYDALETRDPAVRARDQFNRLPAQIAHAKHDLAHISEITVLGYSGNDSIIH